MTRREAGPAGDLRPTDRPPRAVRPTPSLLAALCLVAVAAGCLPASRTVALDCRSVPSIGGAGTDTLAVVVRIDRHPARRQPRLLVRVDPLTEEGAVVFEEGTPPTAAAVALALTTSGTFQGCIALAPSSFELRAAEAPLGRVWLRVSSNVPVAVRLVVGEAPGHAPDSEADLIVTPGSSRQTAARENVVARGAVTVRSGP